jgi:hypothetical protein
MSQEIGMQNRHLKISSEPKVNAEMAFTEAAFLDVAPHRSSPRRILRPFGRLPSAQAVAPPLLRAEGVSGGGEDKGEEELSSA